MDTNDLKRILNRTSQVNREPSEVVINISKPSVGPTATCKVTSASFGSDWEKGMFILSTNELLVPKTEQEEVFDIAYDFIYSLSQLKTHKGNPTHLAKRAQAILDFAKQKRSKK